MLRFARNIIFVGAMFILALFVAWAVDVQSLASELPAKWEYGLRQATAVSLAIAVGVFASSLALSFLLQSTRRAWWVAAYGAAWAVITLFPNMSWVSRSHGSSGIRLGSMYLWGPLLVVFASLLALRVASLLQRLGSRRSSARQSTSGN